MKVIVSTSTFPASCTDNVPDFVKQQVISLKTAYPSYTFYVHAPYNYNKDAHMKKGIESPFYIERRYHYFYPRRFEVLAGAGIMTSLRNNPLLYLQIPFLILFQFFSLYRLARRVKPDVIYAHWFTPQAISSAAVSHFLGIPFLFTTHSSDVAVLKKLPFSRMLVRFICRRAYAYTAVSSKTEVKLASFFSDSEWSDIYVKKLKRIPMGVSDGLISPADCKENGEKYVSGKLRILYMGRLVEKKGVDVLLNALAEMPLKNRNQFELVIAGDGPETRKLRLLVNSLGLSGSVNFVGFVNGSDKSRHFYRADIVCIPSVDGKDGDEEGLPVVLLEALAAGKVVIASKSSGADEIIEDGKNGYLFQAGSVKELVSKLYSAQIELSLERLELQINARELGGRYMWSRLVPVYHEILRQSNTQFI